MMGNSTRSNTALQYRDTVWQYEGVTDHEWVKSIEDPMIEDIDQHIQFSKDTKRGISVYLRVICFDQTAESNVPIYWQKGEPVYGPNETTYEHWILVPLPNAHTLDRNSSGEQYLRLYEANVDPTTKLVDWERVYAHHMARFGLQYRGWLSRSPHVCEMRWMIKW